MTKHEYICAIADVVRSKSDCYKRKVGAVFVNNDYEILATGYNAPPKGFAHCDRVDPTVPFYYLKGEPKYTCGDPCTRTIHAEQNAIAQAAKRGTALEMTILYCTYVPCITCAKLLINIGIQSIYAMEGNADGGYEVLAQASINIRDWNCNSWGKAMKP